MDARNIICICIFAFISQLSAVCVDDHCAIGRYCSIEAEGYFSGHPFDCQAYLYCERGYWFDTSCFGGYLFDSEICGCNYAEQVTCQTCPTQEPVPTVAPGPCDPVPSPCPNPGQRYADQSDCEYFYECQSNGTLTRNQCDSPMHQCHLDDHACVFDVYDGECVHPYAGFECDARCYDYTTAAEEVETTEAEVETTEGDTTTAPATTTTTTTTSTTTTTPMPTTTEDITTEEDTTTTTTTTTTTSTTTTPSTTTTQDPNPTTAPLYCAPMCDKTEYCHQANMKAGNPDNCQTYYQCVYGTWELRSCGAGLLFNPTECFCDFEYLVDCQDCPSTTPRPTEQPGMCPGSPSQCSPGDRYADVSDCEYYYQCIGDGSYQRTKCQTPMHACLVAGFACIYDIYEQECMHPYENFECYDRCLGDVKAVEGKLNGSAGSHYGNGLSVHSNLHNLLSNGQDMRDIHNNAHVHYKQRIAPFKVQESGILKTNHISQRKQKLNERKKTKLDNKKQKSKVTNGKRQKLANGL